MPSGLRITVSDKWLSAGMSRISWKFFLPCYDIDAVLPHPAAKEHHGHCIGA